jgi:hypothetical protein
MRTPTYEQAKAELIAWARTQPGISRDAIDHLELLGPDDSTGFTALGHAKTGRAYVFVNLNTVYHQGGARFPSACWAVQAKNCATDSFLGLRKKAVAA